ncbi:MAG: hypothetical protein RJB01_1777 [Actinomycetota bacterium]
MSKYLACTIADLPTIGAIRRRIAERDVAVVNTEEGVFAIEDRCSHADVALSEGEVDGCTIECWLHGSQFDLRTGVPLSLPANIPVPVYPVTIDGSGPTAEVFIELPEESLVIDQLVDEVS